MSGLQIHIDCPGDQGFRLQVDCELPESGIIAVYGPSGSGKSTLLDCIAGLRQAEPGSTIGFRGDHWLGPNTNLPPWQRNVGYVFQDARLFPHLSVLGNLQYALNRRKRAGLELDKVVEWLALRELLERNPQALSAGQKQRVAIGRALLSAPRLLLLDEPLANLDHAASAELTGYLLRLARELDLPILYVSHDIEEVSQLADHLLLLENGAVAALGPFVELCSRLDTRLSQEEQAAAIALATVRDHDSDYGLTELDLEGYSLMVRQLPQAPGTGQRVRIPARDVSVCRERPGDSSILNILPVTLTEMEHSGGASLLLRLSLGNQYLLARITRKSATALQLREGDALFAQIKSAALLINPAETP